jgi:hypothetical protein
VEEVEMAVSMPVDFFGFSRVWNPPEDRAEVY